ncbi:MAG TPA: type II secretion system F family protein [Verrucomicrobiae bacterium]|nr:type II secretion system F family protein [Verrucomicrobiae bacterium]
MSFSSKKLATFYYQLGTLVQAGVSIRSALRSMQKSCPRAMRLATIIMAEAVDAGCPLSEGMERCGKLFSPFDRHMIDLCARGGALDVGLLSLSKYYESLASARIKLITGSLYPAVLLTAAVFVSHFPAFFLGSSNGRPYTMVDYLRDTAGSLTLLILIIAAAIWLVRWALRVPGLNVSVDKLLRAVPVMGQLRSDYALSRWISSIRLMLRAGIAVVPALEYASRGANSPVIAHAYEQAGPAIMGGLPVSQALALTNVFPDHVIQFWSTGEQSGRMDDMLDRLSVYYEDRWRRALDQTVTWLPRIAYGLVVLYVAHQIFTMYSSYFNQYNDLLR